MAASKKSILRIGGYLFLYPSKENRIVAVKIFFIAEFPQAIN
jgi:hypothetical protein